MSGHGQHREEQQNWQNAKSYVVIAISRKLWLSAQSRNTVAACINMVAGATNAFNGTATVLLDSEVNQKGIIYAPQQNQSPNSRHFHHIIFCPYWTTPRNTAF